MHEVGEGTQGSIGSSHTFDPAHQDAVESLAMHGDVFFSGSRDCYIKKWDLASKRLLQVLGECDRVIYNGMDFIHRKRCPPVSQSSSTQSADPVALGVVPGSSVLLSGCRGGLLHLWHADSLAPLGEVRGHDSPINGLAANSNQVFTASE